MLRTNDLINQTPVNNTPLMNAILGNNTDLALSLINEDKLAFKPCINQSNIGNTALLLALKTGNLTVIHALLSHPAIDVNAHDCFGMNALHWAAFLRFDDVIETIIAKEPDANLYPHPEYLSSYMITHFKKVTPLHFYQVELEELTDLTVPQHIRDRGELITSKYGSMVSVMNPSNTARYEKQLKMAIPAMAHTPLTTLAFHMFTLCSNYCNTDISALIKPDADYFDQASWRPNFMRGYPHFVAARKARAVNDKISEKLAGISTAKSSVAQVNQLSM